jgi:probable rRNA maturation factor
MAMVAMARIDAAVHPDPQIEIHNRQRKVRLNMALLRRVTKFARPLCEPHSYDGVFALKALPLVEISIVSDATIARVHEEFMAVPGPTDVITFQHGEIIVSAETAWIQAAERGHTSQAELILYIIHGLLHLNGYDDTTTRACKVMARVQEKLWMETLAHFEIPRDMKQKNAA